MMLRRLIVMVVLGLILTGASNAQGLRITNEAGGVACYKSQDLLEAHGAIGYYNFTKVQLLIAAERCFLMRKHWTPRITDERTIGGVNVKMVHVRLDNMGADVRIAWALLKNFEFFGD